MYLKSVENDITLGKLIGLLFLFCLPLLSIGTTSPCNGNHFSINKHVPKLVSNIGRLEFLVVIATRIPESAYFPRNEVVEAL